MKWSYYSLSDRGQKRDHNEDAFYNHEPYSLFLVADGMGGIQCWDMASMVALSSIVSHMTLNCKDQSLFSEKMFRQAIAYANQTVFNIKAINPQIKSMGTTLVCFVPGHTEGFVFNIGDSRLYLFRNQELLQITQDHSSEQDALPEFMRGLYQGKFSNSLSRALGTHESVEADLFAFPYVLGDQILLCSDGLYRMLSASQISEILNQKKSVKQKCEELIHKANKAGGEDNITVTLLQIKTLDQPGILDFSAPEQL